MEEITDIVSTLGLNHAPESFTSFPLLPTELRLKIWGFCVPGPRTVKVEYRTTYEKRNGRATMAFHGWTSPTPVPTVLHACREAREEGLKSLELAFGMYSHQATVVVNFAVDTVQFGNYGEVEIDKRVPGNYLLDVLLDGPDDTHKIEKMTLDVEEELYGRRGFCWGEVRLLKGLREVRLCVWEEDAMKARLMAHYGRTLAQVASTSEGWVVPKIVVVNGLTRRDWGSVKLGE